MELVYWPLRGRGQPVATLLEYLQLPYTYTQISPVEWWPHKAQLVEQGFLLANLPYIRDGDLLLAEGAAILAHVCLKAGRTDMLPRAEEEHKFNELSSAVETFRTITINPLFTCSSQAELIVELQRVFCEHINPFATLLAKDRFLFDRLTWVDFSFAEGMEMLLTMERELGVDLFARLDPSCKTQPTDAPEQSAQREIFERYVQRMLDLPGVAEYRASPRFRPRPFNGDIFGAIWH